MAHKDWGPRDTESELTRLKSITDKALLENIEKRYKAGNIYTRSGRIVLAVNPYKKLPLYTEETLQAYKASLAPQVELPPHVYAVASSAHSGMLQTSTSQSVIISGESGAGKTETAKILLEYLAEVSCSGSDLHKRVLKTNPIMESFGCAKTIWNNNSSRFGKFLTLQFSPTGRMQGAFMKTYLLEKSRITSQLANEQNYHVFYTVAKGLSPSQRAELQLPKGSDSVEAFKLLNLRKASDVDWSELPCDFAELSAAFAVIPSLADCQLGVWKVIMAVLYLGNLDFAGKGAVGDSTVADAKIADPSTTAVIARLLSIQPTELEDAICIQNINAGGEWIKSPNSIAYASDVKSALTKALYSKIFDWVVEMINASLISGEGGRYFIGAVDIFGFECFPTNSLEQLCINFANERMQHMFTEAVFESVIAEYQKEGIDVADITFEDNTPLLELIDKPATGILSLLAEECFFPNGTDASFAQKIKLAHARHPCFTEVKLDRTAFTLSHFPGKVTYQSAGFLEKNKDPLPQDLVVLMRFSDDDFVKTLFEEKGAGARRFKSAKFVGVIDSFRVSLNELVKTLSATKTHFIRCVKPNMDKKAMSWDEGVMQRQLYTSGVVQAVQATRKGFPDILPFAELLSRFEQVVPKAAIGKTGAEGVRALLKGAEVPETDYRVGKTKVFLGVGVLDRLEQRRMEYIASKVISMQVLARGYLARRRLLAKRDAKAGGDYKKQQEAKRAAEAALKKKREEEEAAAAAAKEEEAAAKVRQARYQRARKMSFERKTAQRKKEEAEQAEQEKKAAAEKESEKKRFSLFKKKAADEAKAEALAEEARKAAEKKKKEDDVWAQYNFHCEVSDILGYAEYIGMDIKEDAHLLWIADEALQAPEPQGWEQRLDPKGGVYYYHAVTGMVLNQHPLDHHYQQFYHSMKAQYEAQEKAGPKLSNMLSPTAHLDTMKRGQMPALREVKFIKDSVESKMGFIFHRTDDAFDKSFFNVEGSVQPIIKTVKPGGLAESSGLVPGDVVLSVNGISGLNNFQVVEMLRQGKGVFNLVIFSGQPIVSLGQPIRQPITAESLGLDP